MRLQLSGSCSWQEGRGDKELVCLFTSTSVAVNFVSYIINEHSEVVNLSRWYDID